MGGEREACTFSMQGCITFFNISTKAKHALMVHVYSINMKYSTYFLHENVGAR